MFTLQGRISFNSSTYTRVQNTVKYLFYTTTVNNIRANDGPVRSETHKEFSVFKCIIVNLVTVFCFFCLKLLKLISRGKVLSLTQQNGLSYQCFYFTLLFIDNTILV
jgi:hypothetical protein